MEREREKERERGREEEGGREREALEAPVSGRPASSSRLATQSSIIFLQFSTYTHFLCVCEYVHTSALVRAYVCAFEHVYGAKSP